MWREKKRNPWFRSHIFSKVWTYLPHKTGNRLNSLNWYKAIVRCKHLVTRILQHGFKFSSWLKENKISNQIAHHQSATKLASMLQDIKKLQACKTLQYLLHFWYCAKKKTITNIFNHVNTDWLIISILNTVTEKKKSLENRMWRQTSGWITCAKPSTRNTDPRASHTFSRRFLKQNYPK